MREELIAPLLHELGYRAMGEHLIIRGPALVHPYVYLGSKKHKVNIIPDYVLARRSRPLCVLDAKAPGENIVKGPAVEQAYSYAMHKDVRVGMYALCNGRDFTLYHVSRHPSLLHFPLRDIARHWPLLRHYLGIEGTADGHLRPDFRPDLGVEFHKMGFAFGPDGRPIVHLFVSIEMSTVGRVSEQLFTISCISRDEGGEGLHMVSFDFELPLLDAFLDQVPAGSRTDVRRALLSNFPNAVRFESKEPLHIGVVGRIAMEPITNENESYCPFVVEQFIP